MSSTEALSSNPILFAVQSSRSVRGWAFGAIFAVLIATCLVRIEIYLIKLITDAAVAFGAGKIELALLWKWALLLPVAYLAGEIVWRCSGFCGMRWITGSAAAVYENLFAYLTGHSASYFNERFAGALTNKISNASKGLEDLTAQSLWQFTPLVVGLLADLFLTKTAHPYFALTLAGWILIYLSINVFLVIRLQRLSFLHAEASSDLKGRLVDSASNIDVVQYAAAVPYEREYIGDFIGKQRKAHLREWWFSEWVLVTNGILLALFMASMFGLGVWLVEAGEISVGSLVMIITIVMALEHRLFFLGQQLTLAVGNFGRANEGLTELLVPHLIKDHSDATTLMVSGGEVRFNKISFAYNQENVFQDFELIIQAGQKVGLVGRSGAGKSTLVNLLLRQFDVQKGAITIDRHSISEVSLDSLRRAIAFVPQSTSLFHRPVMDNIRYGRLDASDQEVIEAAKLAQVHEFVEELPDGYSTYVGERGVKLSGGQRQRISIARAILKDAPILILDEATSSLDSESEELIHQALYKLMQGKTVLAIAHRLSTLRAMDRIVVLDRGRIEEDGSHEELLRQNGLYASLWNSQVSGFIQE